MTWIKCRAPNPKLPGYYLVNLDNAITAWPDINGGDFWFLITTDGKEHMVDRQDNVILDGLA